MDDYEQYLLSTNTIHCQENTQVQAIVVKSISCHKFDPLLGGLTVALHMLYLIQIECVNYCCMRLQQTRDCDAINIP